MPERLEVIYGPSNVKTEDALYDIFDDLFLEGKFAEADALAVAVDLTRLDTLMLYGLLCILGQAHDMLAHYVEMKDKIHLELRKHLPEERVADLIKGHPFEVWKSTLR